MNDLVVLFLVLSAWIVLNRWVLPWFGIPTCMGGACQARPRMSNQGEQK